MLCCAQLSLGWICIPFHPCQYESLPLIINSLDRISSAIWGGISLHAEEMPGLKLICNSSFPTRSLCMEADCNDPSSKEKTRCTIQRHSCQQRNINLFLLHNLGDFLLFQEWSRTRNRMLGGVDPPTPRLSLCQGSCWMGFAHTQGQHI